MSSPTWWDPVENVNKVANYVWDGAAWVKLGSNGSPTYTGQSLADGQVATSQAAIYTVPASTVTVVTQVAFFNLNAATQTLGVYIKRSGGTARQLRQFVLAQNESLDLVDDGDTLELSTGDAIEAVTTTGSAVDYTVVGFEGT